jgi:hypothetical protein
VKVRIVQLSYCGKCPFREEIPNSFMDECTKTEKMIVRDRYSYLDHRLWGKNKKGAYFPKASAKRFPTWCPLTEVDKA